MVNITSYHAILDLFFSPICPLCQKHWVQLDKENLHQQDYCLECAQKLICEYVNFCKKCGLPIGQEVNSPDCKTCRGRVIYYDNLLFVNEYKTYIGELVVNFKYRKDKLLSHFLSKMILEKIKSNYSNAEVVIPVPMYWLKKMLRGFNQSEMLALEISKSLNLPLATNILKRSKKGKNQAGQSRTTRYKGVKDLYYITKPMPYKTVLLIDDVVTTGSTLSECAKVLKDSGVEKVYCASIAGVHRNK